MGSNNRTLANLNKVSLNSVDELAMSMGRKKKDVDSINVDGGHYSITMNDRSRFVGDIGQKNARMIEAPKIIRIADDEGDEFDYSATVYQD